MFDERFLFFSGEYIQLPLQLEEILQDVLQLADLANENNQVVSTFKYASNYLIDVSKKEQRSKTLEYSYFEFIG